MSKAEDLAEIAYPYPAWSNETTRAIYDLRRNAFIEGYHQAEKDLELTWKDISDIIEIYEDVLKMEFCEDDCMEVLKRFREKR